MKIVLSEQDLKTVEEAKSLTAYTKWLDTNLVCTLAFLKATNQKITPERLLKTAKYKKQSVSIKSFSSETLYPELKEANSHKKFDLYLIAVYDAKKKTVWLDGWTTYDLFINNKNLYKNYYVMSYRDLNPMTSL